MMDRRLFSALVLAVVLLAGLGIWLLIDAWQSQTPVEAQEAEAMNQQRELNTQLMQDTLSDQVAETLDNEQQERMASQLGLALFRKCAEWTEFNDNHPSDNARSNEERACGEYRRYVETGERAE
ncbi:MAG: hypothetical protein OER97_08925 [Gammaproteobacteria bacterium]|nr:hypothetical protein [Gammaproteobacteria bacterium]